MAKYKGKVQVTAQSLFFTSYYYKGSQGAFLEHTRPAKNISIQGDSPDSHRCLVWICVWREVDINGVIQWEKTGLKYMKTHAEVRTSISVTACKALYTGKHTLIMIQKSKYLTRKAYANQKLIANVCSQPILTH